MRNVAKREEEDVAADDLASHFAEVEAEAAEDQGPAARHSAHEVSEQTGVMFKASVPAQAPAEPQQMSRALAAEDASAVADRGVADGGQAYPHQDKIEASFGRPIEARAHRGGDAEAACDTLGAEAYATGKDVAFGSSPSLHTAAHEAAHVMQQASGPQMKGGSTTGQLEQQADAIADRVVAGQSASDLLPSGGGGGAPTRAVQRKAKPEEAQVDPQVQADAVVQKPAKPEDQDALMAPGAMDKSVHTNWFLDFWGVGAQNGQKARGERQNGSGGKNPDVMALEDFVIGPKDAPKNFPKAGNALKNGYAALGPYEHRKGAGTATGVVSYAQQKDLDIKITFPAGVKQSQAIYQLARQKVEALLFHPSAMSGDFNAIENEATTAIQDTAPGATVAIAWKGSHEPMDLDPVDYSVQAPSNVTAKVVVPTSTHTISWQDATTVTKAKKHEDATNQNQSQEGSVDANTNQQSGGQTTTVDTNNTTTTKHVVDKTSKDTHTYKKYGVTFEEIETFASSLTEHTTTSIIESWRKIIPLLQKQKEGGRVEVDHEEPGVASKVWSWLKDKAGTVWNKAADLFVSAVQKFVKSRVVNMVKKLVDAEAWWFPIAEWGIGWGLDWAAGKVKGKLHVTKGKDVRDDQQPPPSNSNYTPGEVTMEELFETIRDATGSSTSTFQEQMRSTLEKTFQDDESSSHSSTTDTTNQTGHGQVTQQGNQQDSNVSVHGQQQSNGSSQDANLEVDGKTETHVYSGTKQVVDAGHPFLLVTVDSIEG